MSHFAKINGSNIVTDVIVANQDFIDSGSLGDSTLWIRTSYNVSGGVHNSGGEPLRKNYAGIGYTYDVSRDAFIPPKPYPSWILNETTCLWTAPVVYPDDDKEYEWNEETTNWKERT